jgi:iduronate 2-sulfatase
MVGASARSSALGDVAPGLLTPHPHVLFFGPTDDNAVRWGQMDAITERREPFYGPSFGPELSASRQLARLHPQTDVAILKLARNGTSLYRDWAPERRDGLYRALIDRTRTALRQLTVKYNAQAYLAGFFWMQGEWDSDTRRHALSYGANLTRFIARIRADLGVPDLPIVLGRIRDVRKVSRYRPFSHVVRAQQLAVAAIDPYTFLVATESLSIDRSSPVHLDTRGIVELGRRFVQRRFGL